MKKEVQNVLIALVGVIVAIKLIDAAYMHYVKDKITKA
jgi:hypothetical protein